MRFPLIAAALAALLAAGSVPAQPDEHSSSVDWRIEAEDRDLAAHKVQFTISRRLPRGQWIHSNTTALAELQGLTAAQLTAAAGTEVRFRLPREAGAFDCVGVVRRGRGTGECVFAADPAFVAGLARRGIVGATPRQLFSLALGRVGLVYVDELERQRYARPTVADLVRAGDHGADLDYLREMGALGYRAGTVSGLVRMRDHGVTPEYAGELVKAGVRDLAPESLVRLRDHGVQADFVAEMRRLGYQDLGIDALVRLRDHGVSADYVRTLAGHGLRSVPAETLVRLRDHGVSADFVGLVHQQGYRFAADDLIRLRSHGVSSSYLSELRSLGYDGLSADEIVRLRSHGVSTDFIRRTNAAGRRSVDELVRLRTGA